MDSSDSGTSLKYADLSFLRSYAGADKELMKKFIQIFLTRTPETLQQMENALTGKEFQAIITIAHNLRPQLSYMGITTATDLVKSIEESARTNRETDDLPRKFKMVKEIVGKASEELQKELTLL